MFPLRAPYNTPLYTSITYGTAAFLRFRDENLDYDPNGRLINDKYPPHYYSPLIMACTLGNQAIAMTLFSDGANYNVVDPTGMSAFLWSIEQNMQELFVLLFQEKGVNLNLKTSSGWGPLHFASYYQRHDIAESLLNNGFIEFDPDEAALDGSTPKSLVKDERMNRILNKL
jgi:ankyrin repeat protein